ncbi:hypothetical protein SAMN05660860_03434 [Geoalkalibacter ferrihydriticus]|uniref:Uncharacterized protein n=2 Tax=Geoalkalibacter ferrihydriticus TaxID=392333 RepID=A0A0C2DPY7_9BACT|nr:hypothetical protein [Geoalkalibacter ferrihydriticus]KIH75449.1 hypothetical protein GFER_16865 [Geoalkalibacter ferrihydriticus DSM 17813]SDM93857.1 hypothetical protein SAMN05660860_03434 [Geoalkalibacter ferrihydriticus]
MSKKEEIKPVKIPGLGLGIAALAVFVAGGLAVFGGLVLWAFYRNDFILGLGTGEAFGYLGICVGLLLSILGVLLMRLLRNRDLS